MVSPSGFIMNVVQYVRNNCLNGGISMKKNVSMILALLLVLAFCSCAFGENAAPSFAEKVMPVVRDSLETTETVTVRCYEDMPNVPYMSVTDFYNRFCLTGTDLTEGMSFVRSDDIYTVTNFCGDKAVFDIASDVVNVDNFGNFSQIAYDLQVTETGGYDPNYPFAKISHSIEPETATPMILNLADYSIDLRGDDTGVYAPVQTLADIFATSTPYYVVLTGEKIYTKDELGNIQEKAALDEDPDYITAVKADRGEDLAQFTYNELCFSMDLWYGKPGQEYIHEDLLTEKLDEIITRKYPEIKTMLLSRDFDTFYAGLNHIFHGLLFDGGHTSMICWTLIDTMEEYANQCVRDVKNKDIGASYNTAVLRNKHKMIREEIRDSFYNGEFYLEQGDTAVILINGFMVDNEAWKDFYAGKGERPLEGDTIGTILSGLERASKNPEIKNIIIDDSCNGGGDDSALLATEWILTGKGNVRDKNLLTNQVDIKSVQFDMNFDGVFDEKDVSPYTGYRYGVLTSDGSFSCGNNFPWFMQENGAMILGERSGGGACALRITSVCGIEVRNSCASNCTITADGETVDFGCPVDAVFTVEGENPYVNFYDLSVFSARMNEYYDGAAAQNDRPGKAWFNSDLYGTFAGRDDIRLQDDFAAAVNREWAENVQIAPGESNTSARTERADTLNKAKLDLLTGEKKDDTVLTSLQNLYHLLLDWDKRNASGVDTLKPYVEDIMNIASIEEMTAYLSDPERNLFGTPMVKDTVMANSEDAHSNLLTIMTPAMFGSDIEDYTEGGEETVVIKVNRQTCEYMLKKLGYSDDEAKALFDKCMTFERGFIPGIEAMGQKMMELGVAQALNTRYTGEEMAAIYKNFPIIDIYKSLGFDLDGRVVCVMMPDVLECVDAMYNNEHLEEIKAWTLLHTLTEFTRYCDRETYEMTTKFTAPLTGTDSLLADEVYAMKTISENVSSLVDEMYVKYCFDKEIKPKVRELTVMMIDAYREMLKAEDWMSEETRKAAIEKLDCIRLNICYPENLPDVGTLTIKSAEEGETLMEAIRKSRRFGRKTMADVVQRKNDGTYWRFDNAYSSVGACYIAGENSINIYAGICGGDYYDPDWPLEKNLGGLCMVVGHEITHAFDDKGSLYDKDGNLKNWWTEEDRKAFQERVDKLQAYYAAILPAPQISDKPYGADGATMVSGEAIADLGSLKCLLSIAAKQENFDYEMFFRQIAIIQKQARYDAAELQWIATDVHPVEFLRCNIPVQNYDEFLQTFGVKEGDGMYLAPEDRITIW